MMHLLSHPILQSTNKYKYQIKGIEQHDDMISLQYFEQEMHAAFAMQIIHIIPISVYMQIGRRITTLEPCSFIP